MTFPHCRTSEVRRGAGRLVLGLALVVSLTGFTSFDALFAPKSELGPRWQAHDAASTLSVDHGPWSSFLDRYVSELTQRAPGRGVFKLKRLLHLKRSYPPKPFLDAIDQALHYGLFDLTRLERLILNNVAGEFFDLDHDDDSSDPM